MSGLRARYIRSVLLAEHFLEKSLAVAWLDPPVDLTGSHITDMANHGIKKISHCDNVSICWLKKTAPKSTNGVETLGVNDGRLRH